MPSKVEIARQLKKDGYMVRCPHPRVDCLKQCRYYSFCTKRCTRGYAEIDEKAVDNYIKRYGRKKQAVKKSFTTDRPNFRKALKDKKAFWYRGKYKDLEPLEDIALELGLSSYLKKRTTLIFRNVGDDNHNSWYNSEGEKYSDNIKRSYPEYNSTTDTFTDHIEEEKEEKAEPSSERETLKSKVMKILSPVAIIAVEEYDRLKNIEKNYNEAKKFIGEWKWEGDL
jgi:hypothetical protein